MVRIAVIGAGASGVTATKACLEEGFDVVVYEKTHFTGGVWRYHDDVSENASVAKSTISNLSKEMTAFSDFPPPDDYPNYMHNTKMIEYLELYGEEFNFNNYIKYRHEIIKCEPADDYSNTGRWKLTIRDISLELVFSDTFDGVMVCTGHYATPAIPSFPDQELFEGKIMHSNSYKTQDGFENKNVVIVGIGNTAVDAATELSTIAKKVYLSTRRGAWILNRVGPNGKPFDTTFITRFFNTLYVTAPYNISCSVAELFANLKFNHKNYSLKPKHRIFSQFVTINDALPNCILSGTVKVKTNIERFTKKGVIFDADNGIETQCDIVLFATGYKLQFPFISEHLIPIGENHVDFYKYTFPPLLSHPKTLSFIGLIQPNGPGFSTFELQSQMFALLMANKIELPSKEKMIKDIKRKRKNAEKQYYSEKQMLTVDWLPFMDEIANIIGVKPNLWKYFFTDPKLWFNLYFGPCVPYQYRLQGPHKWSGARKAILTVKQRFKAPLKINPQ